MDNTKINLLITEALENRNLPIKEWVSLKLERDLSLAELSLLNRQEVKYDIFKILNFESVYLSEEELMHRINQTTKAELSVPLIIKIVTLWHQNEKEFKDTDKLNAFLEEQLP